MELFKIIPPTAAAIPILLSVPHAGTFIPEDIKSQMNPEIASYLDDTDWFVDQLYSFAPAMGITMIVANYSRWVIDLNRDANNQPLYTDGRVITDVVTTTDFNGNPIYQEQEEPNSAEISRRAELYYQPYHQKITEILSDFKSKFSEVLLFDAHSIRKFVPGIRPEPFPALILGDNDQKSASDKIIQTAVQSIENQGYEFSHNHPFKGGQITRSFGNPLNGVHALQLEMIKTNYMDDSERNYDNARAEKIQSVLKNLLQNLIHLLA